LFLFENIVADSMPIIFKLGGKYFNWIMRCLKSNAMEPSKKVLNNKSFRRSRTLSGLSPAESAHGALKACWLLGHKATTSPYFVPRQHKRHIITLQLILKRIK